MKYKALVIGAGSIGALKPDEFDSPESKQIYTHAHACYSHPNIDLVGIVDHDMDKAEQAANKWNTTAYGSINEFKYDPDLDIFPDIVIVATNTNTHYDIIHQLIPYKPKVIICEKPFCSNLEQAHNISELCKDAGINLIVNYTRTFVPELKELSNDLKDGKYGEIYNFTLRYSRGLMREACHAFYWCLQTFGPNIFDLMEYTKIYDSPTEGDYSSCKIMTSDICRNIAFLPVGFDTVIPLGKAYSTYNADIYTEKGRIELLNNWKTIRYHENVKSTYGDYKATGLLFEDKQTQLDQALTFLLDHAIFSMNIDLPVDTYALDVHKHLKLNTG